VPPPLGAVVADVLEQADATSATTAIIASGFSFI
jgi:hypothetical protein